MSVASYLNTPEKVQKAQEVFTQAILYGNAFEELEGYFENNRKHWCVKSAVRNAVKAIDNKEQYNEFEEPEVNKMAMEIAQNLLNLRVKQNELSSLGVDWTVSAQIGRCVLHSSSRAFELNMSS